MSHLVAINKEAKDSGARKSVGAAAVVCSICATNPPKYKCPRCRAPYCSLACFKTHKTECAGESAPEAPPVPQKEEEDASAEQDVVAVDARYEAVARDPAIQALLRHDALRFHLRYLFSLLSDAAHAGEGSAEGRRAVALRKLTELRVGGLEANELVEEFCARAAALLEEQEEEEEGQARGSEH